MPLPACPSCLSGIVVTTSPERLTEVDAALGRLPGVEVHHRDVANARLVIVQEAATIDDEVAGMQRILGVPGVADASLVYHYLDEGTAPAVLSSTPAPSTQENADDEPLTP